MRDFDGSYIFISFDAFHHISDTSTFVGYKVADVVSYGDCSGNGKPKNGKCQVGMSHNATLFATKHLFSPSLELFI